MSHAPRPCTRPSATTAANGSCRPALARLDRDDVDVAVEEQRPAAARAGEACDELRTAREAESRRAPSGVRRSAATSGSQTLSRRRRAPAARRDRPAARAPRAARRRLMRRRVEADERAQQLDEVVRATLDLVAHRLLGGRQRHRGLTPRSYGGRGVGLGSGLVDSAAMTAYTITNFKDIEGSSTPNPESGGEVRPLAHRLGAPRHQLLQVRAELPHHRRPQSPRAGGGLHRRQRLRSRQARRRDHRAQAVGCGASLANRRPCVPGRSRRDGTRHRGQRPPRGRRRRGRRRLLARRRVTARR